jgi:heme/copper-type cytochrome/quinol oxidase subunit 2
MRKIISLAAIAAIVGTVTFWTIVTHVKSNAAHVQATEASAPVSPHEIMVKQGTSIPVVLRPGFETPGWAYSGGQL